MSIGIPYCDYYPVDVRNYIPADRGSRNRVFAEQQPAPMGDATDPRGDPALSCGFSFVEPPSDDDWLDRKRLGLKYGDGQREPAEKQIRLGTCPSGTTAPATAPVAME
jgi:hypothetical protein